MLTLLRKEVSAFFSSLTGYIIMAVFLIINSLFLWVFPGELNVLDSGYASLDTLFTIAPWVYLFLVPAVTMRMISEEKKTGTIELLLTKPLRDTQIILAKYASAVVLVLLALLPTLLFYVSIYILGNPTGNIDTGGVAGSFIGLFFLATGYVAIGVFSSSISDNQVISFIIAILISFFFYIGFDSIASLYAFSGFNTLVVNLGINEHYKSMSRGVIDSRDLIYFLALSASFIVITRTIFQSRKW